MLVLRQQLMLRLVLRLMRLLLKMLLMLLVLLLLLAYVPIYFRMLSRGIDWRYNGGIQFSLFLTF